MVTTPLDLGAPIVVDNAFHGFYWAPAPRKPGFHTVIVAGVTGEPRILDMPGRRIQPDTRHVRTDRPAGPTGAQTAAYLDRQRSAAELLAQ